MKKNPLPVILKHAKNMALPQPPQSWKSRSRQLTIKDVGFSLPHRYFDSVGLMESGDFLFSLINADEVNIDEWEYLRSPVIITNCCIEHILQSTDLSLEEVRPAFRLSY